MLKPLLASAALAFALAACAATPTTAPEAVVADAPPVAEKTADTATETTVASSDELDPNEEICERVKITGSVLPSKVCMTRAQWASQREQGKEVVDNIQRGNMRSCAAGPGCGG